MIILFKLRIFFLKRQHKHLVPVLVSSVTSVWKYLDQRKKRTWKSNVAVAFIKLFLLLILLRVTTALLMFQNSFENPYKI